MKKYLLLLFFSILLFVLPLFRSGFYRSHDGEVQVARIGAYVKAFEDKNFPPRWAGDLNYRYGSPVFIFYYPFPSYISVAVHSLGINLEDTFKIVISLAFILGPLFSYLWLLQLFSKNAALVGALLYGLAPYHFLDLYVRGDIAELVAFVFLPLTFYFIEKIKKADSNLYILFGSLAYALLILSHNGISLIFSPVLLLYSIIKGTSKNQIMRSLLIFPSGLLLSAYFWIPALLESKYVTGARFISDMYKNNFPTLLQLIHSPWGFGPDVVKAGGLSPQIGIPGLALVILSITFFLKTKDKDKKYWFWLFIFAASFLMTLPASSFVWGAVPLLNLLQFPWRIVGLISFAAAFIGAYVIEHSNYKWLWKIMVAFILIFSLQFVGYKELPHKSDTYYYNFPGTTYFHGEASPIWTAGDPFEYPKKPAEIIGGNGTISNLKRQSQQHSFNLEANSQVEILDNTLYFPGWGVLVDGKEVPIEYQDINHRGLITFNAEKGRHMIKIIFAETKIRLIADYISLFSFLIVCLVLGKTYLQKND